MSSSCEARREAHGSRAAGASARATDERRSARARRWIEGCDALVIGAGAGLSAAAGFTVSGARFAHYFSDFQLRYGLADMYSGGFYPFESRETYWAWWSRVIWVSRFMPAPVDTYARLCRLAAGHDYFVLTTNVDHQFQIAGFDKQRLFYTQGDYGLLQDDRRKKNIDDEPLIRKMILSQGFRIGPHQELLTPAKGQIRMEVDPSLAREADRYRLNLRVDDDFLEDDGWHAAATKYGQFLTAHEHGRVAYLELGVGANTPGIIKYPFWQRTFGNPDARYITVNAFDARYPTEIAGQSLGFRMDINRFLDRMLMVPGTGANSVEAA